MQTSAKVAIVIVIILTVGIILLESGVFYIPPTLEQRQDTVSYMANQNVVIEASTFNGNIDIEPTSDSQITVTYTIKAPSGHLDSVKISNNEAKSQNQTTLTTSAKNLGDTTSTYYAADLTLKLPTTSQYNLTLVTVNGNITKPQLNESKVAVSTLNGDITLIDGGAASEIGATSMTGNIKISLAQGTLFNVTASVGTGAIDYQGITLDTSVQSATRLQGATAAGEGTLNLSLATGTGTIKLQYYTP
ncbi:MAG: DUF4097 family beta strand repeat-containing protein [Candidatus Bathyarchaeota archaeon]|nr:DUF4097 family beta strand repeat-containing protein [Candidatus Bathyarchaeota archaeon]